MNRRDYLAALLRLYREQPDTPDVPRRGDGAVAAELYRQGIPLDTVAHAIRLATLRRLQRDPAAPPLAPIRSLAYYRTVLATLTPDDFHPGYVAYIARQHADRLAQLSTNPGPADSNARFDRQDPALPDRR
jgi:hypothetical protein